MEDTMCILQEICCNALYMIVEPMKNYLPQLLGGLAILIIGWLVALGLSTAVAWTIKKTRLEGLLANSLGLEHSEKNCPIANSTKTITYYIVMLFVLVAFFQTLGLTLITEPLNEMLNQIFAFAPSILGAVGIFILAWLIATVCKKLILKALETIRLDEMLAAKTGKKSSVKVSVTISETIYWLVLLLILPSILTTLHLNSLVYPLNNMFTELLGNLPNIFNATIILLVGWFLARVVQRVVTNLLASTGADNLIDNMSLGSIFGKAKLSEVLGIVSYVFILFPVLISALDALNLNAVVGPATQMLNTIFTAVPYIIAALLMLAIAVIVGRFASTLVGNLLQSIGFDNLMSWLGVGHETPKDEKARPSNIVSKLVLAAVILFASVEAFNMLGLASIGRLLEEFIMFAGEIILGIIVLAIGLILSNLAAKAIKATASTHAELLATAARIAILVLATAMGLEEMGIASEIIDLAFGILFGAVAIAIALAFGLGCKDIASREMDKWLKSIQ